MQHTAIYNTVSFIIDPEHNIIMHKQQYPTNTVIGIHVPHSNNNNNNNHECHTQQWEINSSQHHHTTSTKKWSQTDPFWSIPRCFSSQSLIHCSSISLSPSPSLSSSLLFSFFSLILFSYYSTTSPSLETVTSESHSLLSALSFSPPPLCAIASPLLFKVSLFLSFTLYQWILSQLFVTCWLNFFYFLLFVCTSYYWCPSLHLFFCWLYLGCRCMHFLWCVLYIDDPHRPFFGHFFFCFFLLRYH